MAAKKNKKTGKNGAKRKKLNKIQIFCLALFVVVLGAYLLGFAVENKIDEALGLREVEHFESGDLVTVGALTVHFIDVGQGDACLIELPDERTMLIDAGENKSKVKDKLKDYMDGVNTLREQQGRAEIKSFDYAVLTHSDSDHSGSMAYIFGLYPARTFYRPNEEATYSGYTDPALNGTKAENRFWGTGHSSKNTATYKNAIEAGYKANASFTPEGIVTNPHDNSQNQITPEGVAEDGDLFYKINFYGPVKSKYSDVNNNSPIIIIEYKSRRIALSGDCEKEGEQDFVNMIKAESSFIAEVRGYYAGADPSRYTVFDAAFSVDIVKLGHHGSRTSSSEDYLNAVTSSAYRENVYVVISCGKGNSYKHPHEEVLTRLDSMGFNAERRKRTDEDGDVFFNLLASQGKSEAVISMYGTILPAASYTYDILGIQVRYRYIGLVILVVLALVLIPSAIMSKKKIISTAAGSASGKTPNATGKSGVQNTISSAAKNIITTKSGIQNTADNTAKKKK